MDPNENRILSEAHFIETHTSIHSNAIQTRSPRAHSHTALFIHKHKLRTMASIVSMLNRMPSFDIDSTK